MAAQLLAAEAGADQNPPRARVHLSQGRWLTLRAARIGSAGAPQDRDIAVSIEETSPPERLALFARAFGLSAREAELLRQLAAGGDTRDLARQMFLSEHTVQDYLKSIFTKTGAQPPRTAHTGAGNMKRRPGSSRPARRHPHRLPAGARESHRPGVVAGASEVRHAG